MDVVLTSEGLAAIQAAAPGHVAAVRETFIDRLSAQDLATLDRLSATVIDGLHNPSHCPNDDRTHRSQASASVGRSATGTPTKVRSRVYGCPHSSELTSEPAAEPRSRLRTSTICDVLCMTVPAIGTVDGRQDTTALPMSGLLLIA